MYSRSTSNAPEVTAELFNGIVHSYCSIESVLARAKAARFPRLSVVMVDSARYHGPGIVVVEDGCRPENLAVRLQNDNVWHYPALACEPIADRKKWPEWIRRQIARANRLEAKNAKKDSTASNPPAPEKFRIDPTDQEKLELQKFLRPGWTVAPSDLQKRLGSTFDRVAFLMETAEKLGLVGPADPVTQWRTVKHPSTTTNFPETKPNEP